MGQVTVGFYGTSAEQQFLEYTMKKAPPEVKVKFVDSAAPLDAQITCCADVEVMLPIGRRPGMDLLTKCPRLKLLQVIGAGTDNLDKIALTELGIRIANGAGANSAAVSEHAVLLMLMVYRKAAQQVRDVKNGEWYSRLRREYPVEEFHELTGKTVGIIGLGRIGSWVAKRLQGWDCRVLYYDIRAFTKQQEDALRVQRVDFGALLRASDVVTLHVPLTPQTRGMIGKRELAAMKPGAILINTCRGPVVDEKALYDALRSRRLLGAGIDVTTVEPTTPDNPLLKLDNITVTPHHAGYTIEWYEKGLSFAVQNAARLAKGEEPQSLVGPTD